MRNKWAVIGLLATCSGAWAQENIAPKSQSPEKSPIEINSDALEVLQDEHQAIFRGNVLAVQENMRLRADVMTVYYKPNEKEIKAAEPVATESKKNQPDGQQKIDKIEAKGKLFLSTPGETASAARGVYDVTKKEIRLFDQVVLTRGQNVIKGEQLVYDIANARSRMVGNTTAGEPASGGKMPTRVRGVFVPNEEKNKKPAESKP